MNDFNEIESRVQTLLLNLGQTPEAVARTLSARGVTGVPGELCNCPVYNFLAAEGIPVLGVVEWELEIEGPDGAVGVPLPQSVTDFITAFDRDDNNPWPELVAEVES